MLYLRNKIDNLTIYSSLFFPIRGKVVANENFCREFCWKIGENHKSPYGALFQGELIQYNERKKQKGVRAMPNYRLTLCYDGTRWKGWQKQGNTDNTIQGKLENLLSRLLDQPVEVAGSGRTDAGTHAKGQVASFRAKTGMSPQEILAGLRQYLPADIGAVSLEEAEPRFHARLSCVGKTYVYRIWRSQSPNVFERNYLYFCPGDLNVEKMRRAASALCGRHDFRAFCSLKKFKKSTVRTVESITIEELGPELRLTFSGDGFLYHMVRILVGTLLAVGRGELEQEDMADILESQDRQRAGETVPACGLCLEEVRY